MKKFFKSNTIICVFALISILIVVSYAITYNMPDYFGIEAWYSLFNNISISYIAAFIFYILQVYKPECDDSKRAKKILEPLFNDLIKFLEVTIACCRRYVLIDEEGKITIDWDDKKDKVLYFIPIEQGINEGKRPATKKSVQDIKKLEGIYKQKITEIKDRVVFKECDSDIISAFAELEAVDFFKSTIITAIMLEDTFVKFSGFNKEVDKFESVKDKFKRSCGIEHSYNIKKPELMEIAALEAFVYKNTLNSTDEFSENACREYLRLKLKTVISDKEQLNATIEQLLPGLIDKLKDK